jgi:hypothetical protein
MNDEHNLLKSDVIYSISEVKCNLFEQDRLNIEILDCFSHYTLVIQIMIVVLHLFFI